MVHKVLSNTSFQLYYSLYEGQQVRNNHELTYKDELTEDRKVI